MSSRIRDGEIAAQPRAAARERPEGPLWVRTPLGPDSVYAATLGILLFVDRLLFILLEGVVTVHIELIALEVGRERGLFDRTRLRDGICGRRGLRAAAARQAAGGHEEERA